MRVLYIAYPLLPVSRESAGGAEQILATLEGEFAARGFGTAVAACEGSCVAGRLIVTGRIPDKLDVFEAREAEHHARILEHMAECARAGQGYDLVHDMSGSFWRHAAAVPAPVLATLHLPRSFYAAELFSQPSPNVFFNCVSAAQARSFADVAGMAGVVQNGIVVEQFPSTAPKYDYLLWLGRICEEKGTHLAIAAAACAGMRLVLAGQIYPFSYHQKYYERCVRPHLNPGTPGLTHSRITFVDTPSLPRKVKLLRHARALLIPSLCEETSSLVAMEAMACGTPVIAFPRGGIKEVVRHGETGFFVDTPEQMAEAAHQIAAIDPRACRSRVEALFSHRRMADDYEQLYAKVMA